MIEVTHLTKFYGPRAAVHDLTFQVAKGEIVGFLGPNGAGKSTTMKILTGFMPASEGKATVAGFDVFEKPLEVKKNVGYLPETPPVYLEMVVEDYLAFAARLHDVPKDRLKASVSSAVEKTGLGEVRKRIIGNLSKGFRQRVGLAQALVHNPPVLILDEPTVGLDPKQIIDIRSLIQSLAGDHTVILSSHILPEITATCQRIIVINKGRIVAQDSLESITRRLKHGLHYGLVTKVSKPDVLRSIQALPGVASARADGAKILIEIRPDAGEVRDRIVEEAVKSGAGVLEFAAEKLSLEEVFLELTTEENLG